MFGAVAGVDQDAATVVGDDGYGRADRVGVRVVGVEPDPAGQVFEHLADDSAHAHSPQSP